MTAPSPATTRPDTPPSGRYWHICTGNHATGQCTPACVAYCGHPYRPGKATRDVRGCAPVSICRACRVKAAKRIV